MFFAAEMQKTYTQPRFYHDAAHRIIMEPGQVPLSSLENLE